MNRKIGTSNTSGYTFYCEKCLKAEDFQFVNHTQQRDEMGYLLDEFADDEGHTKLRRALEWTQVRDATEF